jgi:hypothetical protein
MGVPIRESDDNGLSDSAPPANDSSILDPSSRQDPLRNAMQRAGMAMPEGADEPIEPPRRARTQRGVFEGDVAAMELRSRLARARDQTLLPAVRRSSSRRFADTLRYAGLFLVAAAGAGLAGYLLGGFDPRVGIYPDAVSAPSAGSPHVAGEAEAVAATPDPPAASLTLANRDSQIPAAQTAAADLAPAPPAAPSPPAPAADPAEAAARMKIGADLIASGDIVSARTMFERVAEAGEAAGAFALAETYDPSVLKTLRLRGGIKADPALARRWYEKARDMGSAAAAERIERLARSPR